VVGGGGGAAERGFRLNFAGAKTNRCLFRAAASRPVTDGHESSPDRPQSGIIEKSGGYFCEEPGKIQTKASAPRPADGGHGRAIAGRALREGGGGATSDGKRGKGFRVRGSGRASKGWQGGGGGGRGRGTATRTDTDKHGQTRTFFRGQNSEVRESPEVVFPRYGKFIFDFSMLWKNNFHGVENLGRYGARGADFFHGVEKMFPQCGKVLWGDGAAGGGRWGVAGGVGGAGAGAPVEEGEAGEE
jgi:hypothetical protein